MDIVQVWEGLYDDTVIAKFIDKSDGVACCILGANNVIRRSSSQSSGFIYDANSVGSISCIKLTEEQSQSSKKEKNLNLFFPLGISFLAQSLCYL